MPEKNRTRGDILVIDDTTKWIFVVSSNPDNVYLGPQMNTYAYSSHVGKSLLSP